MKTTAHQCCQSLCGFIALWLLAAAVTGSGETITGTFRYADLDPASNLIEARPIQFCRVEVHSFRPRGILGIWSWSKDLDTMTDANGSIWVRIGFEVAGVVYGVKVFAENYGAIVWPNDLVHTVPFHQEPGQPDGRIINRTANNPGDVLDFSYDFTDSWSPQHYSLADAVRHGFDYVAARRDPGETDSLPPAAVQPGFVNTFYNPVTQTLSINDVHVFEDYTVLHEYAHFVEHHLGSFAVIASIHNGCSALDGVFGNNINSAELAWMEGFAEFFAMAVWTRNPTGTFGGHPGDFGTFSVKDLERAPWPECVDLPANVTPDMIENNVAGMLWDLFDQVGNCGTSEAHDNLGGFDTVIIQIMDHEMALPRWPTVNDFIGAWLGRGLPAEPFLDILRHHRLAPDLPAASLLCPANLVRTAPPGECSAAVTFLPPALNQDRRCAVVICNPPSGATFPVGTTTVNCRAVEAGSAMATCSFTVTVNSNSSLPPKGRGLLGIYYDNPDFTAPRWARVEAVNFDWGLGAPAPGVAEDTFSVRWSGRVMPGYSATYKFYTVSDDGVRLWVDGQLIINNWTDHPPTENYGFIHLQADQTYDVVMEMYENGGFAVAQLLWEGGCQAKEPIPANHLLPARLESPTPGRPTFAANFTAGRPPGLALFGDAEIQGGWLKLTRTDNAYGIAYVDNFSGAQPVYGFEASFQAALFGSLCCGGGALPADGFSFNLVPAATVRAAPDYGEPGEEGLNEGLAVNFDSWDNGGGEAPAVEVKWLGQVVARTLFQPSQSPAGITDARSAAREVLIQLSSDGKLTASYGGEVVLDHVQTPYSPSAIGAPQWVLGARNGTANDNHWIRNLQIIVNQASIPGLFSTGVDDLSHPLAEDALDPHYRFWSRNFLQPAVVTTAAGGSPIGPWLPDDDASAWIAPSASTWAPENSEYRYETSFDLNGLNPSGAVIHGWVAVDNFLVDILVNGQSTGQGTPLNSLNDDPFTSWMAFAVGSGLRAGSNNLSFVVNNWIGRDNPTGLRVELSGWAAPPPLLKIDIARSGLETTLSWGSLPHKRYFVEHNRTPAGDWVREPLAGIVPRSYQARFVEGPTLGPIDPVRFYRVVEEP